MASASSCSVYSSNSNVNLPLITRFDENEEQFMRDRTGPFANFADHRALAYRLAIAGLLANDDIAGAQEKYDLATERGVWDPAHVSRSMKALCQREANYISQQIANARKFLGSASEGEC